MAVIKNVVFNYVKIKKPAPKYGKKEGCPISDCEYAVDICLPAAAYKDFKKHFKTVAAVKNAKTFTAEEYKETFKVDAPSAKVYANGDGEYTVVKFTAYAGYKNDGEPVPEDKKPLVQGSKSKTKTGDGKEIGRHIEVGNGSTGKLSFSERTWEYEKKPGLSLDLTGIQVETLIEYVSKVNEDEFEYEEEEDEFAASDAADKADSKADAPKGDGSTPDDDIDW